ncbi:hydrogenase expression/formation protein [Methanocalculus alkaliphilus]|uniref:AIR synthase-related protein n=1 Tax=Methanocalculus alkaliphilus TaxID=768730 RepID=UPI00209E6BBA|nr:AIR synthase-related protein [Methanocalculus alkaliphilus]MCP1714623.1 hydrogenase expression/formation protein [Methanocalculus alkaliphilus]
MDIEGYVRRHMHSGISDDDLAARLRDRILEIKEVPSDYAEAFARAAIEEVRITSNLSGDLFTYEKAGISMGAFGVGSRGTGDFYAHRKIAEIIGETGASVGVSEMDDGGVVPAGGQFIITTVDGMHSRLSDYPFLAGFHATRATLRDVYVMGARPVGLISDIHVADDGDVARIFDYTAGITAVGEALNVPLIAGSTLRIGGDMVIGDRMTGCVGVVGVADHITARRQIQPGDLFLMTEGAGGGTIATAAIYSGNAEVVEETINLHFLHACDALIRDAVFPEIHAMTDVTNGGLRGDVFEMAETAGCRIIIEEEKLRSLVNPRVLALLDKLGIDYLGVSLDSLLVVVPPDAADRVLEVIRNQGVAVEIIGIAEEGEAESVLKSGGKEVDFSPKFREAPYTPLKKVVDTRTGDFEAMKKEVDRAAAAARMKKERILKRLR